MYCEEEDLSSSSSATTKRCPSPKDDDGEDTNRPKRQRRTTSIPQAMSHMAPSTGSSETVTVQGNEVPSLIPYLQPFRPIIIDASYAAKKSFRIRELMQYMIRKNPKTRILCLSVRIIHSFDMLAQLKDLFGFQSYKDITTERDNQGEIITPLGSIGRLICSYESLHRLYNHKDSADQPQYDVLVLDEFRSLCDTMCKKGDMIDPQTSQFLLKHFMYVHVTNSCHCRRGHVVRQRVQVRVRRDSPGGPATMHHQGALQQAAEAPEHLLYKGWHAQNSKAPDKPIP